MAKEPEGDQVRDEVRPGGTEGGRRPTGVPPWGGGEGAAAGTTLDRRQETRSGAAPLPGGPL